MLKKILIIAGALIAVLILFNFVFRSGGGKSPYPYLGGEQSPASKGIFSPAPFSRGDAFSESSQDSTTKDSRLVIKSGNLNLVVKDIPVSVKAISDYAESKGGWVVGSRVSGQMEIPAGVITVRVPAKDFEAAFTYFKGLSEKVSYEEVHGQDVTEEYTDLESRLRNLEATEKELLKIMSRSGAIADVLNVQKELTVIRDQIEQTKGRIQYLGESVKMATLSINLALEEGLLPIPESDKWRPVHVLKLAWSSLLGSLKAISYLLIWVVVFAVIWVPLWIIIWQARKFWKRRKSMKKT